MDELVKVFSGVVDRQPTDLELDLLQTVFRKRGLVDAQRAVVLVHNEDFRWVRNDKLSFLINDATWNKHLVPAMAQQALPLQRGEQAEFGPRPDGSGYRREW